MLEGRFGVQLGDDVFEAAPGDIVVEPRGVPHTLEIDFATISTLAERHNLRLGSPIR